MNRYLISSYYSIRFANFLGFFFKASRLCDLILEQQKANVKSDIDWIQISEQMGIDCIEAKIIWKYLAYGEIWTPLDFENGINENSDDVININFTLFEFQFTLILYRMIITYILTRRLSAILLKKVKKKACY